MHLECIHCEHISHATQSSMSTSSSSLSPHTIHLSSPLSPPLSSVSSCCSSCFLFFFLFICCCCFSNCFPLLQVLLHNALGAGLFCSTCGLLPTFSLAMASPLLVKKINAWFYLRHALRPPPPPPPLNVIMTLTVGKMICESPLLHVAIRILGILNEVVLFVCGV